jgi:hypothetical protein
MQVTCLSTFGGIGGLEHRPGSEPVLCFEASDGLRRYNSRRNVQRACSWIYTVLGLDLELNANAFLYIVIPPSRRVYLSESRESDVFEYRDQISR